MGFWFPSTLYLLSTRALIVLCLMCVIWCNNLPLFYPDPIMILYQIRDNQNQVNNNTTGITNYEITFIFHEQRERDAKAKN